MATKKTNKKNSYEKVIRTRNVNSWDNFSNLFKEEFFTMKNRALNNKLDLGDYVWRGHRRQDWKLLSSFDREFKTKSGDFVYVPDRETILKRHLNSFVYAIRSRLKEFGLNVREIKAAIKNNLFSTNHIWALGQHYGLKTPLLDWCYSPYVAAYFAFQEKKKKKDNNRNKIVWGLNYKMVCDKYKEDTGIDYFDPMSSEHPRLINQRGLFTITKSGEVIKKAKKNEIEIEEIVKNNKCAGCNGPWLIKIKIIDGKKNREEFLRRLNVMGINHMTLFPDIKGAAEFSNIGLEFLEYARFHGQKW